MPQEAVIISHISSIRKVRTLRDRIRPVTGGVQIVFPAPSEGPGLLFACSVGFNARIAAQPGRNFFVTASHCSDIPGGNQETPYAQPFPDGNSRIATEFKDPRYGNPGGLCYEGFRCRLSNALLARYVEGVPNGFGTIARTTFVRQRNGSIRINPNNPRWTVVGELGFPFEGEIVHKVGSASGWTRGPVVITCGDFNPEGTDIILLCQDVAQTGARGGDSGAGVFERAGPDEILLTGILWGRGTLDGEPVSVFSAMEQIEHELGQLSTSNFEALASAQ